MELNKILLEDEHKKFLTDILFIPLKIKSRNEIDKYHWAVKKKLKQEYCLFIRNQMRLQRILFAQCKLYKIIIISYRKRLLDFDNLVGGCKQMIDAMTDEKLIFDDSPEYLEIEFKQYKSKKDNTIIIRVDYDKNQKK